MGTLIERFLDIELLDPFGKIPSFNKYHQGIQLSFVAKNWAA